MNMFDPPRSCRDRNFVTLLNRRSSTPTIPPMKNGKAAPKSISDCLANYVERHKELITTSWVQRVRNSLEIPTDSMMRLEIIDHIPDIFDAIIRGMRQPLSETAMEQIQETSGEDAPYHKTRMHTKSVGRAVVCTPSVSAAILAAS